MAKIAKMTKEERATSGVAHLHRYVEEYKGANDQRVRELEGIIENIAKRLEAVIDLNDLKVPTKTGGRRRK